MNLVGRLVGGAVWLAVIVAIAVGGAGLITAMNQPPSVLSGSDLTAAGDAEVGPLLDAAEADLGALADQVETLGTQARGALAALNGADGAAVEAAIAEGDRLVADVTLRTARIRVDLAAIPYVGSAEAGLSVSPSVVRRHAALVAALNATEGLDASWARLTVGSLAATRMSVLLAEHDRLVGTAAARGVDARYGAAIKLLDEASATLVDARSLRNRLVATVDVTVLDEWLTRNEDYDVALRDLYEAISSVGKKVTAATRRAVAAEATARARLPADSRAMIVIMADIGRGGMTGAVIAIEEARAQLDDALQAAPVASDEPEASPGS